MMVFCGYTHITRGIYFRRYFLFWLSINALAILSLVSQLFITDNVRAVCGLMFLFGFPLFFSLTRLMMMMMMTVTA